MIALPKARSPGIERSRRRALTAFTAISAAKAELDTKAELDKPLPAPLLTS